MAATFLWTRTRLILGGTRVIHRTKLFRHFFRHSYEFSLDETKTVELAKHWRKNGSAIKQALKNFCKKLDSAASKS